MATTLVYAKLTRMLHFSNIFSRSFSQNLKKIAHNNPIFHISTTLKIFKCRETRNELICSDAKPTHALKMSE
jgi:hypothetical protein